jgi:hypothetical protein
MRSPFCWTAPLALMTFVIGCNTVDPSECWPNTSGGFGGSGTIPIGAGVGVTSGDFLSPPPKHPLDNSGTPNPCIQPQSSCNEKCLADYEAAAIVCGKIADATERKTCQDDAYANNKSCLASCQQSETDCLEKCRQNCDKENQRCIDQCPKGDKTCFQKCNEANGACLKDCDRNCK